MPTSEFAYFDGRERAFGSTPENQLAVYIDRHVYPRPVESAAEARALYVTGEIGEAALEHYLEGLIDADE